MDSKLKKVWQLFCVFFRIGAFTFGGGYAMIPLIQREVVENKGWITDDDILNIIAIAESTPGPIAINSATFVGYKTAGFWGAFAATSGVVLPSFIIISLISLILTQFEHMQGVKYAFFGIRAGVLALIGKAWYAMFKKSNKHIASYIISVGAFVCAAVLDVNVLFVIIGCAIAGYAASALISGREKI